jgi:hypothetical protein
MKPKPFTGTAAMEFLESMAQTAQATDSLGTNIERLTGFDHRGEGFKLLVYGIIGANQLPQNPKIISAIMDGFSIGAELGYMHGAAVERVKN